MRVPIRPAVVAALTPALVAAGTAAVATPASAAPAADLAAGGVHAPVPVLCWTDCSAQFGAGVQCTTAQVPLDYDHPTGPTIGVALNRHLATDPAHRVGSLFLNPGGPGGSGETFLPEALTAIDPSLPARFDLIGVDPAGHQPERPGALLRHRRGAERVLRCAARVPGGVGDPGLAGGVPGLHEPVRAGGRADHRPLVDRELRPRPRPAPAGAR